MASWITALFSKLLLSKSLTADFFKILSFKNYYLYNTNDCILFCLIHSSDVPEATATRLQEINIQ